MAAIIKGLTTLVFGCDVVAAVINQSIDGDTSGDVTWGQDEDGDYVSLCLHSFGKREASGEYLFKGADIVTALGVTVTLANVPGTGVLYVYTYGRKQSNNGFVRGTFKAAGIEGITV